jgi:hypothetical protein
MLPNNKGRNNLPEASPPVKFSSPSALKNELWQSKGKRKASDAQTLEEPSGTDVNRLADWGFLDP